ncbi:MAG: hypothetical protein VZR53_16360 [Prevotella sp.]|nr:hypothetical protein [Prevotella sp.]
MKEYDNEIYKILIEAGDNGLKIEKIARHVYNACNSIFFPVEFDDVHKYVTQFLLSKSKQDDSLIEKSDTRGIYRLNFKLVESQQLMLRFGAHVEKEIEKPKDEDQSLSLF